ncbi:MAG: hypothetical protein ABIN48_13240 [Ginsengibacter sp.]
MKKSILLGQLLVMSICLFGSSKLLAQTTGAGIVTSIESKARQILDLESDIKNLKRRLISLESEMLADIKAAEDKLQSMLRHIQENQSWKNRLKTAREGWEEYNPGTCSAGGPPPICVVNHWFKVDVKRAMEKYEEYKDKFLQPYRDAIKNAGDNKQREIDRTKREINNKEEKLPDLRAEIVTLSKRYESHIKESGTARAGNYGSDLVRRLSETHFQERMVAQYTGMISESRANEIQKKNEALEKVSGEIKNLTKKLENDLKSIENKFDRQISVYKDEISRLQDQMAVQKAKIREEENTLYLFKGKEADKLALEERIKTLNEPYYRDSKKVTELENKIKEAESQLFREKSFIQNKLFELRSDTQKMKAHAEKMVEDVFKAKRELLETSLNNSKNLHVSREKSYHSRLDVLHKEFQVWAGKVESERRRIMSACQSVNASCNGVNIVGDINLAWNLTKDCLKSLDRVRNTDGVIYGCTEMRDYYVGLNRVYEGKAAGNVSGQLENREYKNRLDNLYSN